MQRFINILFLIFSLVLYYNVPENYSFNFCLLINLSFVIQNILYFVVTKRTLISFEFFFAFAFYFINFIYPVAYFPTNPTFSVFDYTFNYMVINKATALAFVAYTCYMAGLTFVKRENEELKISLEMFSSSFFKSLLIVFLTLAVSYIISVGSAFFSGYDWYVDEENFSPAVAFINMSASLFAMFIFFEKTKGKRLFYLVIMAFFISIYLLSGSRNLPLTLLIILLLAYHEVIRKIPSQFFLIMLAVGIVIFYFISTIRTDNVLEGISIEQFIANVSDSSVFDFATDLIVNNRNLYVLVDFADSYGYTYGLTMLSSVLMLVPYAGTFVSERFGIPLDFMYVAGFNTYLEFGFGSTYGLGGNIVADIYLSFGFVGVLIAFPLLGFFVSKVVSKYRHSVVYFIIYFTLVGSSVFMNRESFLLPLRPILYTLLMFWILNNLYRVNIFKFFVNIKEPDQG